MTTPKWLARSAEISAARRWSLGHVLAQYMAMERCSAPEIVQELSISAEGFLLLCACRLPRAESFAADIRTLEDSFKVNTGRLIHMIRTVQARDALMAGEPRDAEDSVLMAARDRLDRGDE